MGRGGNSWVKWHRIEEGWKEGRKEGRVFARPLLRIFRRHNGMLCYKKLAYITVPRATAVKRMMGIGGFIVRDALPAVYTHTSFS